MKEQNLFHVPPTLVKLIAISVLIGVGGVGSAFAWRAGRIDLIPLALALGLAAMPLLLIVLIVGRVLLWLYLVLYWYLWAFVAVIGLLCALPLILLREDDSYTSALAGLQLRGDSIGALVFGALAGVVALVWVFGRLGRKTRASEPPDANPPDPVSGARDLRDLAAYVDRKTRK
ncbi:MAG: hypothetical protein KJ065_09235 [Anaerolineae bacterium]|nr:hypothetical protein [Anaerolineae bacterium]